MIESLVNQVLRGNNRFLMGNLHRGGGNQFGFGEHRVFNAAAQRVFYQQLFQFQVVLRQDQVLLVGRGRTLRTHYLNGRHGSDLRLLLGIGQRLLRIGQRFLLHAHVFVGIHQIPIHIFDLVDGGDDLQAEGDVRNFTIVLGDADETQIRERAKALQKILRNSELEVRTQVRT